MLYKIKYIERCIGKVSFDKRKISFSKYDDKLRLTKEETW